MFYVFSASITIAVCFKKKKTDVMFRIPQMIRRSKECLDV